MTENRDYDFSPNWLHGQWDGRSVSVNRYSGKVVSNPMGGGATVTHGHVAANVTDKEMWRATLALIAEQE